MLQNIINDPMSLIVIGLFVVAIIIGLRMGYKKKICKMLYDLVCKAEKEFGGETGELKFNIVAAAIYEKLPVIITLLFTEKDIEKLIEEAVKAMKKTLENNSKARTVIMGE